MADSSLRIFLLLPRLVLRSLPSFPKLRTCVSLLRANGMVVHFNGLVICVVSVSVAGEFRMGILCILYGVLTCHCACPLGSVEADFQNKNSCFPFLHHFSRIRGWDAVGAECGSRMVSSYDEKQRDLRSRYREKEIPLSSMLFEKYFDVHFCSTVVLLGRCCHVLNCRRLYILYWYVLVFPEFIYFLKCSIRRIKSNMRTIL